jgi:hypothetical protein
MVPSAPANRPVPPVIAITVRDAPERARGSRPGDIARPDYARRKPRTKSFLDAAAEQ